MSWNHRFAYSAWRHDLNTNFYELIGDVTNGVSNGYVRDPLPAGSRVQYELWSGNPTVPGSTLFARTPEARVYGPPQKGDSSDGTPATPPNPTSFVEPSPDTSSDEVGAVAGQFHIDEMGHAEYQIPLQYRLERVG